MSDHNQFRETAMDYITNTPGIMVLHFIHCDPLNAIPGVLWPALYTRVGARGSIVG
jgi:hypothetical protein